MFRTSRLRRTALTVLAAPLALGAAVALPAQSAQAHSDITNHHSWEDTDECPCWQGDEYDGTQFLHDSGGRAAKTRFYEGSEMVGKMEFHPYDEQFWYYDTAPNHDALWFEISWSGHSKVYGVPSGSRYAMDDLNIPEGTKVTIRAYDSIASTGVPYNLLATNYGTA